MEGDAGTSATQLQVDGEAIQLLVKDLKLRFAKEMLHVPTMAELKEWHDLHPGTTCDFCLERKRSDCAPDPESLDYSSCAFCATSSQATTPCSWRLHELRFRVLKSLNIDDQTFHALELQTREARSQYLSQLAASMKEGSPSPSVDETVIPESPSPAAASTSSAIPTSLPDKTNPKASSSSRKSAPGTELRKLRTLLAQTMDEKSMLETKVEELSASKAELEERCKSWEEKYQNSEMRAKDLDELVKISMPGTSSVDITHLIKTVGELKESLSNVQTKKDILSQRVKALEDMDTANVQRELIEHANLHVLIRLLSHARDDFANCRIMQDQMLQMCDNLGEQLKEVAARRLERAPVGFYSIDDVMRRTRRWDEAFDDEDVEVTDSDISPSTSERALSDPQSSKRARV